MKKSEAIEIARAMHDVVLDKANTHFSNVNKSKSVWWIEVPLQKLNDHQTINLVVEKAGDVTLLQVPTEFLKTNIDGFKTREAKQMICLELDIDTFENRVGSGKHNFKSFVV